jgi:hypothetical protein
MRTCSGCIGGLEHTPSLTASNISTLIKHCRRVYPGRQRRHGRGLQRGWAELQPDGSIIRPKFHGASLEDFFNILLELFSAFSQIASLFELIKLQATIDASSRVHNSWVRLTNSRSKLIFGRLSKGSNSFFDKSLVANTNARPRRN